MLVVGHLPQDLMITSELVLDVKSLLKKCGQVEREVEDFLYFSAIIYTVDKLISRKFSEDNWFRDLEIHIKLQSSQLFNANKTGGLDSLIGCINWLEDNPNKKLILVDIMIRKYQVLMGIRLIY